MCHSNGLVGDERAVGRSFVPSFLSIRLDHRNFEFDILYEGFMMVVIEWRASAECQSPGSKTITSITSCLLKCAFNILRRVCPLDSLTSTLLKLDIVVGSGAEQ